MAKKQYTKQEFEKIQSDVETRWLKKYNYYRWFFSIVLLALAIVLFSEKVIISGVCVLQLVLYICPLQQTEDLRDKLGKLPAIFSIIALLVIFYRFVTSFMME